jgi:hypothetical protein
VGEIIFLEEEEEVEEVELNVMPIEIQDTCIGMLSPNIGSLPLNWGILY